jgi:DNA-binding transcriptional LysR family regulator
LDTELLRTFLEVHNTRHFGRAADNLYITQAAVSARIRQLEQILNAPLFERQRNNIHLTPEGERLLPHAQTVLATLARARQDLALEGAGSSPLFLGVRAGLWGRAVQRKVLQLAQAMPDLVLRVDSRDSDDLLRKLSDRTLDLALMLCPPALPELDVVTSNELELRLYSTANNASLPAALAGDYVYLDWGSDFARFHVQQLGEQPPPVLRTNIVELAVEHLQRRGGAAYFPQSQREVLAQAGLRPVRRAPVFTTQLALVHHREVAHLERIEQLVAKWGKLRL